MQTLALVLVAAGLMSFVLVLTRLIHRVDQLNEELFLLKNTQIADLNCAEMLHRQLAHRVSVVEQDGHTAARFVMRHDQRLSRLEAQGFIVLPPHHVRSRGGST